MVLYVVLGVPGYLDSPVRYLDPAEQYSLDTSLPVWWFAPAMVAWTCGLGLAALVAHAARRRFLALVPLAVAAAIAPLIVHTGPGLLRDDPAAARLTCTDGTPQFCLTGHTGSLLPQVAHALTGLTGRLEGVPDTPARYVDRLPLHGTDEAWMPRPNPGWYLLRGRLQRPEDFAMQVAYSMLDRHCPSLRTARSGDRDRVWATDSAVGVWLAGPYAQPPGGEKDPRFRRLDAMPVHERRAWLSRYFASRDSCTPSEVPVL